MSLKEKPLFDAVKRTGPIALPGNAFWGGILSMYLCGFFSAFMMVFWAAGYGAGYFLELYNFARPAWYCGVAVAFLIHLFCLAFAMGLGSHEAQVRVKFFIGGIIGIISMVMLDMLSATALQGLLADAGKITGRGY